jgi:hypothetical protein
VSTSVDEANTTPLITRGHVLGAAFAAALALVLWLPLVADTSQGADSSEWVLTALTGSMAHPPGYPLWSWLCEVVWGAAAANGSTNPYHVLGVFNCVLQAIAAGAWVLSLGCLGVPALLASMAMVNWLMLPSVGLVTTYVEVFALHHLFAAVIVGWCGVWWNRPRTRSVLEVWLFGVVCAFAFAHHQTIVLWAPLVALVAWRSSAIGRWRRVVAFLMGAVVGLAPYLHLFVRYQATPMFAMRKLTTAVDLKQIILREDYGTFAFAHNSVVTPAVLTQWISEMPLGLLAVVGLTYALLRRRRIDVCMLVVIALHVLFVSRLRATESQDVSLLPERFYALSWLAMMSTLVAVPRVHRWLPLLLIVPLVRLPDALEHGNARDDVLAHQFRGLTMANADKQAVVFAYNDEDFFGLQAESVLQHRNVLVLLRVHMENTGLGFRMNERFGLRVPPDLPLAARIRWLQEQGYEVSSPVFPGITLRPHAFPLPRYPAWVWLPDEPSHEAQRAGLLDWCAHLPNELVNHPKRHTLTRVPYQALDPLMVLDNFGDVVDAIDKGDIVAARALCTKGVSTWDPTIDPLSPIPKETDGDAGDASATSDTTNPQAEPASTP